MSHRVLVVEDDASIQGYCNTVLESAGFTVDSCRTVAEARKLYFRNRPDLAVVDIGLPDGSGLDLLREWKTLPGAAAPVLFLTACGDLKTRLECFQLGGQDYVHKPFAAEELLARVKVHLHLKESHDALIKRNYELELVNRARQDMADMIVHDLKAPLASIKGTLDLVRGQGLISEHGYASLIKNAGQAADFMLLMLNDLLDVGQAGQGRLQAQWAPVELPALFEKLRGLFAGRAALLQMTLLLRAAPDAQRVVSDQNLLYRVLANLIVNAMKASHPGAAVEVDASRAAGQFRFIVSDRGTGVPETMKEKIFEKYVTSGRAAAPAETGSGIGLSFCRVAAHALEGRIWVEDRLGGGSRFILQTPDKA